MRAYMWRNKRGEWLFMVGVYRNVEHARSVWEDGGRMAETVRDFGAAGVADVARAKVRYMIRLRNDPNRHNWPLAT